jgi:hypothetical protein
MANILDNIYQALTIQKVHVKAEYHLKAILKRACGSPRRSDHHPFNATRENPCGYFCTMRKVER